MLADRSRKSNVDMNKKKKDSTDEIDDLTEVVIILKQEFL